MYRSRRARVLPALIFGIFFPAWVLAQSGSGVITGIVKDSTGGALPGAIVRIANEETGVASETITNGDGAYRFSALVPGRYRLEVDLSGFESVSRQAVTLAVDQTLALDVTLGVARQSEEIKVVATAPLVQSQTSNVDPLVTREVIAALPLPNRAASSLASLAPGVIMVDTGGGTAENYPLFSVAGGRVRNQYFMLDGGNASNVVALNRPSQILSLPVDAMQEFKVITNNYAAEYGHSTGGVITMATRSGTNKFKGSAFESLRNDALDAKNFFAEQKPAISLNQFGGTLGGPIARGRSFFFGTWERTRQLVSDAITSTVPTLANRRGDFSDLRNAAGQPILIYDPQTRLPFPGNVIPAARIDPVALAALGYFPMPNRQGTATNASNYVGNSESTLDR